MALGASRGRLLRQVLLESGQLAAGGATLDALVAQSLSRALVNSLDASQNMVHLTIVPDWRVLLFAAAVAILTCLIFGTAGSERHQHRAADIAEIRRTWPDWRRARAILCTARNGDYSSRRLHGASGGRFALCAQLSQSVDAESGDTLERDHYWIFWISVGERQTRKPCGLKKAIDR